MTRFWPVVGYAVLAVVFTWPMPSAVGSRCWGHQWDLWGSLWAIRLLAGGWPVPERLADVFYPVGYDVVSDLGHFLVPLCGAALSLVAGVAAACNLLVLGSLVATGLAGFWLLRVSGSGAPAAFAGGAVLAFNPYCMAQVLVGSVEMLALWGIAGVAACLTSSRYVLGLSLLAATFLANIPYAALCVGLVALWALCRRDARWGTVLLVFVACVAPYVWMLHGRVEGVHPPRPWTSPDMDRGYALHFGQRSMLDLTRADLEQYAAFEIEACSVRWSDFTTLAAPWLPTAGAPSVALLALALVAPKRKPATLTPTFLHKRFWTAAGALALLLSLGPSWWPYRLLYDYLPGFGAMHHPYVFLAGLWVALAVLLGMGLDGLLARVGPRTAAAIAACVAWLFAAGVPALAPDRVERALVDVSVPPRALLGGAVIEVPFMPLPMSASSARSQYHQLSRGETLFNARLLRRSMWLDFLGVVRGNPVLHDLARLQEGAPRASCAAGPPDVDALRRAGFRWVVLPEEVAHESLFDECLRNALYGADLALYVESLAGRGGDLTRPGTGTGSRTWRLVPEPTTLHARRLIALPDLDPGEGALTLWTSGGGSLAITVRDSAGHVLVRRTMTGRPSVWRRGDLRFPSARRAAFVELAPSGPIRVARVEVSSISRARSSRSSLTAVAINQELPP